MMSDYAAFRSNFLYSQLPLSFMSETTEDTDEILYFVVGKPQADSIHIALRENVSGLKKAIRAAAKLAYSPPDLVIWKVRYSMAG